LTDGLGPFEVDPGRPAKLPGDDRTDELHQAGEPTDREGRLPPLGLTAELPLADQFPEVSEETVRALLTAQGALVHGLVAIDKASDEWVWLEAELAAIVPPLTRIVNRYDALRQLAEMGDPLAVLLALGGYGKRSLQTRAADATALAAAFELDLEQAGQAHFRGVG
jgi:hypothetical protein